MNQRKIDIVDTDNWQALYLNGKKVAQVDKIGGDLECITAGDVFRALNIPFEVYGANNQDCKEYFADLKL
jgi:hypothetical protein